MLSVCLFSLFDAVGFYAQALSSSSLASFVAASLDKSPLTSAARFHSAPPAVVCQLALTVPSRRLASSTSSSSQAKSNQGDTPVGVKALYLG